jgi:DeoR/GlpR family transcriptional regulator of sugar metabolism
MLDHSKFEKRALHAHLPLTAFDVVIVDASTPGVHVDRLRDKGITVMVADPVRGGSATA